METDAATALLARCGLHVDVESQALICRSCKYALATANSQITTHLDKKHRVSKVLRLALMRSLRQRLHEFKDPCNLPVRPHRSAPHPELYVHQGYACRECEFYTISLKWMTSHLSKVHLSERASKPRTDDLYDDVFLQTWGSGPTRSYWTVSVNGSILRQANLPCAGEHLKSVREREQARREEQQRIALTDTGTQTLQNTGPWIERTRWPIAYQGVRRDILLGLADVPVAHDADDLTIGQSEQCTNVTSPAKDEQKIWHVTQAIQLVLDRCEETMRRTGRPLLCWLITTRPSPCFPKPFKFLAREQTRRSYRRWLKGFLAFVFRAWRMEPGQRSILTRIRLSPKQSTRLQSIWEHRLWDLGISPNLWSELAADRQRRYSGRDETTNTRDDKADDEEMDQGTTDKDDERDLGDGEQSSEARSSSHQPTPSDRSSEIPAAADDLLQLLFELCIAFMTEEFRDGQPSSSTLVYYSGVLGLQGTGETFRTAKLFTPILSQLIYIQRLLFLEYALPYEAYVRIGLEQRPRYGQLERLNAVRLKYMVDGAMYPLAEFQSLRDFGRVIGRTDPPSFLFRWSEDGQTISYSSNHVTMDSFRRFSHMFVDEAEKICKELMFGVLPPVDLSQVKDEISNTSQGFSFVHHPGNRLSEAYLELSTRACTTRRNGLLRDGRWNWKAIFLYLKRVEAFLEAVAGMCYLSGGQVPRVSELFSLACENTAASARGLYVYNARIVYLIRHHKAKRSTNREFYVARYLPARASQVVYYYLVYIWPFVRMLQRERVVSPSTHSGTLLFCSVQTPDQPWESRKLTAILQRASAWVWGWPVNAQLCRQLTIAITEKHVKEVHQRFNRYDDKSPNADMNVAYAWQSGHRPLQRANTYGLDGAFPTHLQPSLLRVYEWVSTRWHEFLTQPSKDSPLPSSPSAGTADRLQHPSLLAAIGRVFGREKTIETRPTPSATPLGLDIAPTRKRKRFTGDKATCAVEATASKARRGVATYSHDIRHSPQVVPVSRLLDDDTSLVTNDSDLGCTAASLRLTSQRRKQGSAATLH
ncbi:DUF3505 domain-containing protein [Pyrenophora tritici-repentis]|nr:DUF3505 domain-containing protein [Pyrenophora tritici-repentis]